MPAVGVVPADVSEHGFAGFVVGVEFEVSELLAARRITKSDQTSGTRYFS